MKTIDESFADAKGKSNVTMERAIITIKQTLKHFIGIL